MTDKFNIPDTDWDRGAAQLQFDHEFEIDESSYEKGEDINPSNALLCYTDGSKHTKDDETGVGCAYHISESNNAGERTTLQEQCFNLQVHNSVYQAEVTAIQKTAEHLHKLDEVHLKKDIYILTDSRSALHALHRHWVTSKTVNKCLTTLRSLATKTKVTLRWIKAHVNHKGNEQADRLAKAGASAHMTDVQLNGLEVEDLHEIPPPYSYLTQLVTKGVETLWSERWLGAKKDDGAPIYRQTKFFFKKPDKNKAYNLMRVDRDTLGRAIQFITGHAFLRRHDSLVANATNPSTPPDASCRLCKKGEETPFHLIMECEELFEFTKRLFKNQTDDPIDPQCTVRWSASALTRFINLDVVKDLMTTSEDDDTLSHHSEQDLDDPPT